MRVRNPPSLPPAGFDPINESDGKLEKYWLPSRPDPRFEPDLYEHWKEMFSPPLRFVWAGGEQILETPFETSRNWSGAYILPNYSKRLTRVVGRWKVPSIRPGTGPNPYSLPHRCSVWIGLDGKKNWADSMPQVGSDHQINSDGSGEMHRLWCQWWIPEPYSKPHGIAGVSINVGDAVLCSLTVITETQVRFHVKNGSTGEFATIGAYERRGLRGSSAEWIVERPANPGPHPSVSNPGPLFPLPNYDSLIIERCAIRVEETPGGGVQHRVHREPFQLIRMVEILDEPTREAVISTPSVHNQPSGAFKLTYHSP